MNAPSPTPAATPVGAPPHTAPSAASEPMVQSVDRALRLLSLVAEHGSVTMSDAARHLGIHRSSAMRLLNTLRAHDLLSSHGAGEGYVLGQGLVRLGAAVPTRVDFTVRAQEIALAAAKKLNETVNVAVIQDGAAVTIAQANGDNMLGVTARYVGRINPLHATSVGKLQLAAEPNPSDVILDMELTKFTEHTLIDPQALITHIHQVRAQGWAAANEEWEDGMCAVAVPVRNAAAELVAAISATAPSARLLAQDFAAMAAALDPYAAQLSGTADAA